MAKGNKCPVCGHWTYRCNKFCYSLYDWVENSPYDACYCSYCKFVYEEFYEDLEEKQVYKYARELYGKDYDDWIESKIAEEREG